MLSLSLLLGTTFIAHSAIAQVAATPRVSSPDETTIAPVIVTARKRAENVQTVPETITAIDAREITGAHLTTLDDFNSQVTNIDITQRADNTPDVVIRGVGTFGVVQGVGFYVNGVQQFDGQSVRPDDIERIEVLKGPQGTLFGGSNVGGAIRYVTKLPTDTPSGEATFEYGSYNERTVDGAVSGPIIPGKLLARLSVFNDQSDGYLFDPIFNRKLPRSDETGGRLTLEYLDNQTTALFYFSADHIDTENMNLYYTPPNDHSYSLIYNGGVDGVVPHFHRYMYSPTLDITHDFGSVSLKSITSYFHSSTTSIGNLDKGAFYALFGLPIAVDYPQDFGKSVFSEELRLSSNGNSPFKWLLGAFVQRIGSTALQIQQVEQVATIGSPVGETPLGPPAVTSYRHTNRDYALFGNASYDLGHWTFEGGLRIGYFDNTMTDTTGVCAPCSGKVSEVDVLPMASIDYHFSKDIMVYGTIARGDEEGDLTDNADPTGQDEVTPFKTEYALSYEAGVKSELFDDRLILNAAAFYIDYTNRIFEVGKFVGGGIFTFNANVGSSRNYGFELEAQARPTPELSFTGGLGVTKVVFGAATVLDGNGNPLNTNGHGGPDTPAYTATLAADWRHHLTNDLVLNARIDARFVGRALWDAAGCNAASAGCPFQGADSIQRPYQIVNAGVSLDVGRHWSIGAHVQNLFDARYNTFYADLSETGAPFNVAGINRPRQWFVNATARF
ncbi:MAG: TonB-dependent receptor [Caulobacteraceae bacterium]